MPDLRPVERLNRQMSVFERDFIADVSRNMKQTRLALVNEISSQKVNSPYIALAVRHELDNLRRQITWLAKVRGETLDDMGTEMARSQIIKIGEARPNVPLFDELRGPTSAERRGILDSLVENITNFIDSLQAQLASELSRLRTGNESPEVVIDRLLAEKVTDRASVWHNAVNAAEMEVQRDLWTAVTGLAGTYYNAGQSQAGQRWQKQAIAAIDERTTDCCLQVHGQTQELNTPFLLTGTPRYSDHIQHPPFHWYCRTGESLWIEEFEQEGVTTPEMRDAAQAELTARQDGSRKEIHPAHATSRRS
jgi:hypothetical protein